MAVWGEQDGWLYEVFPLDTPASELRAYCSFKQLWDDKRSAPGLPAWRDFQLEDFGDWYGWVIVEDIVSKSNYDAVFRLWGTKVTELYGADLTGKRISEIGDDFYTETERDMTSDMCRNRLIGISTGAMKWKRREFVKFGLIELPLADDGYTIDKMLSLVIAPSF